MKTKIILILIIVGSVLLDISCNRSRGRDSISEQEVSGINGIRLYKKNTWFTSINVKNPKDTFAFDSLLFGVDFQTMPIAFNDGFSFISAAYAEVALPIVMLNFDSIKIISIKNGVKTEATNQFLVSDDFGTDQSKIDNLNPDFIQEFLVGKVSMGLFFQLNTPPSKTDTYQFNFQFFDKKGRMFEKMSEPVVIAP